MYKYKNVKVGPYGYNHKDTGTRLLTLAICIGERSDDATVFHVRGTFTQYNHVYAVAFAGSFVLGANRQTDLQPLLITDPKTVSAIYDMDDLGDTISLCLSEKEQAIMAAEAARIAAGWSL